jgi:hypothetical protein
MGECKAVSVRRVDGAVLFICRELVSLVTMEYGDFLSLWGSERIRSGNAGSLLTVYAAVVVCD